jgi:hypothetical protein
MATGKTRRLEENHEQYSEQLSNLQNEVERLLSKLRGMRNTQLFLEHELTRRANQASALQSRRAS